MEWISLENDKPKHLQPIALTNGNEVEFGFYRDPKELDKDDPFGEWADFSFYDDNENWIDPTHWMPLPNPPK